MKTIAIAVLIGTALIFTSTGCVNSAENSSVQTFNEISYFPASHVFFETTLEGLESRVPNVVRGFIQNDATVVYQSPASPERGGRPGGQFTSVSLEITQVIQGELGVGDIIRILEPYFIEDGVLFTHVNYLPSIPGKEYFFFLGGTLESQLESFDGAHFVVHGERGRFLVPDNSLVDIHSFSRTDLSLGEQDTSLYMSLWQEVIDAYMN